MCPCFIGASRSNKKNLSFFPFSLPELDESDWESGDETSDDENSFATSRSRPSSPLNEFALTMSDTQRAAAECTHARRIESTSFFFGTFEIVSKNQKRLFVFYYHNMQLSNLNFNGSIRLKLGEKTVFASL